MFRLLGVVALVVLVAGGFFIFKNRSGSSANLSVQSVATENLNRLVQQRAPDAPAPNVIILLADDLGWADVGYRGSDIETPNLDRLAAEGMRLERFYATPFCTPTRAALMTGKDPIRMGVAHAVLMAWDNGGVSPVEHFMPETFKGAGYQTAIVGKWHLGHTIEQHTPNARGFDHFYGHFNTDVDYFSHSFASGYDFQENGVSVRHDGEYATDVHGDQAVRYIKELRDPSAPFFLYVPFLAPHSPVQAKDEDIAKYGGRLDLPGSPKKTYAAMVDSMDQAIGRILDALTEENLAENTIVLFFSDNGGFKGFGASNDPLRGQKLTPFEGGVRVNALLRWPAVIPGGVINDAVVSVLDVFPSLAEAADVTPQNTREIDGVSRWDAILGAGAIQRKDPLFFTSNISVYNVFQYGVLDGPWKLYQKVDHQRRSTSVETMLFNVWGDPNESTDVSADNPQIVERLQNLLDKRLAQHPVGGTYVKIQPHPGWRAPLDYAAAVLPAESVNEDAWSGFGPLKSRVLQQTYGERGRIIYE
ncbi:MAG: arylsulfatase [Pseudomonadota bacterium]